MSDAPQSGQAAAVGAVPAPARLFAAFCFVLALLGLLAFWPPRSPATLVWLVMWTLVSVLTGIAILRRARYAPALVWTLITLAGYSAVSAFRGGLLGGVGILIDMLLGIPLVWFAIWYQTTDSRVGMFAPHSNLRLPRGAGYLKRGQSRTDDLSSRPVPRQPSDRPAADDGRCDPETRLRPDGGLPNREGQR